MNGVYQMEQPNVDSASEESQRQRRIERLLSLRGELDLELDDWYELRHGADEGPKVIISPPPSPTSQPE